LFLTFGFVILVVFLVLSPSSRELRLSCGHLWRQFTAQAACAIFALLMTRQSLNVCSQILVILIIITGQNGIAIVRFANMVRDEGKSMLRRSLKLAIRPHDPIMMTMTSTVLGGELPLN
jgi:multidrug efflux pump